ncbi:Protein sel-1-like protein [Smittium culicis]|uniref:Protein sel-1-like protein n=1 Tax=Smittium culicis TaxID=133412 RepID=A0A1R1YB38_9FUNG|nr:Protein sel-1-like protein [Smittium culicis]
MALDLYLLAYEFGDNDAAYSYATIKYLGAAGVEKDLASSREMFIKLSRIGHPYAQLNYATILIKENDINNVDTVVELLNFSSKAGVARANLKLGELYKKGNFLPKNNQLALYNLEIAVEKGLHEAMFLLGDMYSKGELSNNNEPNYDKALELFQKAASHGVVEAQYNLGVYYLNGYGTPQSLELAVEYWEMASVQGFPMAALNLAKLYLEGYPADTQERIKKDPLKAKHYLHAAKKLGKSSFIERDADMLLKNLETISPQTNQPKNHCIIL